MLMYGDFRRPVYNVLLSDVQQQSKMFHWWKGKKAKINVKYKPQWISLDHKKQKSQTDEDFDMQFIII